MSEESSIAKLDEVLCEFFGANAELQEEWINTSLPVLGRRQPKQLFNTTEGRNRVIQILGEMTYGEMA